MRMKKSTCLLIILLILLFLTGYQISKRVREKLDTRDLSFSERTFSQVQSARLRNMYNGNTVYLSGEDVDKICAFLQTVRGTDPVSSKGWYDGCYSLELYSAPSAVDAILAGEAPVFSIGFGDHDSLHHGTGSDGYPLRYTLSGMTIEPIRDFFSAVEAENSPSQTTTDPAPAPESSLEGIEMARFCADESAYSPKAARYFTLDPLYSGEIVSDYVEYEVQQGEAICLNAASCVWYPHTCDVEIGIVTLDGPAEDNTFYAEETGGNFSGELIFADLNAGRYIVYVRNLSSSEAITDGSIRYAVS